MAEETNAKQYADERRLSAETKRQTGCRRCSLDKRKSIDRKCSVAEQKYLKDSDRPNAAHKPGLSAGEIDSQIYRSIFDNKSALNKKERQTSDRPAGCNCRGCTDYMRGLKV